MVSGSSRLASQANSSVKVSPWKVRGLGIFLASGGSMLMTAQCSDGLPGHRGTRLEAAGHHRHRVPAAGVVPPPGVAGRGSQATVRAGIHNERPGYPPPHILMTRAG